MEQENDTRQTSYQHRENYLWNHHAYFLQGFSLGEYKVIAKEDGNKENKLNPSIWLCNS